MNLTILPPTLHFLQLPKTALWAAMPAITHALLLADHTPNTFVHYTETLDEVSLLVDSRSFRSLSRSLPLVCDVRVSPFVFRALSVSEGEIDAMVSFDVTTGLVSAISTVLAANAISIFYVSTYQTDYVVIKAVQVELATQVLRQHFGEIEVEDEGEMHPADETDEKDPSSSEPGSFVADANARSYLSTLTLAESFANEAAKVVTSAASSTNLPSVASATGLSSLVSTPLLLHALPQTFHLAHFSSHELTGHLAALLRIFFFPNSTVQPSPQQGVASVAGAPAPERFFSYSNIDSSICLMLDSGSLSLLQAVPVSVSFERWRGVQVAGEFGFDECGIVAALSGPLTTNKICPFYLSTYCTDYVLVQESKWTAAEEILQSQFQFVQRERKQPNVVETPTPAPAPAPVHVCVCGGSKPNAQTPTGTNATAASFTQPSGVTCEAASTPSMPPILSLSLQHSSSLLGAAAPAGDAYAAMTTDSLCDPAIEQSPYAAMSSDAMQPPSRVTFGLHQPLAMPADDLALVAASRQTSNPYADFSSHDMGDSGGGSGFVAGANSFALPSAHVPSSLSRDNSAQLHRGIVPPSPHGVAPSSLAGSRTASGVHQQQQQQQQQAYSAVSDSGAPVGYSSLQAADLASGVTLISTTKPTQTNETPYHAMGEGDVVPIVIQGPAKALPVASSVQPSGPGYTVPLVAPSSAPASADSFEAMFKPVEMGSLSSSSALAAGPPALIFSSSVDSFGHTEFERLVCFRDVDRLRAARLLGTADATHSAMQATQAANPSYSGVSGSQTPSSGATLDGSFLLRPCLDPSELLEGGTPNPNLFVLCYNRGGLLKKSKIYRLPGLGLSLSATGNHHRIFPSLHAIIEAIVGANAKPVVA